MGSDSLRRRWGYALGVALLLSIVLGLLFPWGASAYYLERAGRRLDQAHLSESEYRSIERDLDRALRWDADNARAYQLLARTYDSQGKLVAAVEAQARYAELQAGNPLALWQLAAACEQLDVTQLSRVTGQLCGVGQESREITLLGFWQEMGHSAASMVVAADRLRRDDQLDLAEFLYQQALRLETRSAAAWFGLAGVYQARGNEEAALTAYARVTLLDADPALMAAAHRQRGALLAGAGQWLDASHELAQAVALAPEDGDHHLDYGWYLYQAGGELPAARAELRLAAGQLPNNPWPHLRLAQIALAANEYEAMLAHTQTAVVIQPTSAWAWYWQGRALRLVGRLDEAELSLRHAVELAPDRAEMHAGLANLRKAQGAVAEAIAEYERAVELAPGTVWINLGLADTYRAAGQRDRAVAAYRRALALDANNAAARQALQELGE